MSGPNLSCFNLCSSFAASLQRPFSSLFGSLVYDSMSPPTCHSALPCESHVHFSASPWGCGPGLLMPPSGTRGPGVSRECPLLPRSQLSHSGILFFPSLTMKHLFLNISSPSEHLISLYFSWLPTFHLVREWLFLICEVVVGDTVLSTYIVNCLSHLDI